MRARTRPSARVTTSRLVPLLTLAALLAPLTASSHPTHPGKWTSPHSWGGVAVHMMLVPGRDSYHSRIVWWAGGEHIAGGVWGWSPPADATVNGGTYPTSSFSPLGIDHAPADPFCSGHAQLGDGKVLVAGGNTLVEVGIKNAMLLDQEADPNGSWTSADSMSLRRWYPTVTVLGDGRAVTTSGNEFFHYVTVGGVAEAPTDTTTRMLERFGVAPASVWGPSVVALRDANQSPPYQPLPPFSEAAIAFADSRQYLFGGRDGGNALTNEMRWIVRDRNVDGQDYKFIWASVSRDVTGDPTPTERTGVTAVSIGANEIIYIGGLSGAGARPDVYHAQLGNTLVKWKKLVTGGPELPELHGHVAVFDGGNGHTNRIFVWGGTSAATPEGAANNTAMYSITVQPTLGLYSWELVTQSGTPPTARKYSSLTLDPIARWGMPSEPQSGNPPVGPARYRAMLFGGQKADGSYTNELYSMWIKGFDQVEWQQMSVSNPPTGRSRHGAAADVHPQWLVISGGETASGIATQTVFAYDLACGGYKRCDQTTPHWEPLLPLPRPTRSHSTVLLQPEPAFPRHAEVYDPRASVGSQWRRLDEAPQWQEWYPFGFTMPRRTGDVGDVSRVFYAGPVERSMMLTVNPPGSSTWTPVPATVSSDLNVKFMGGSAVMYRPGKVMKCGTRDTEGGLAHGKTALIDLKAETPIWNASTNRMIGRNNHNLVLLPDGEVLVVGGANTVGNGTSNPTVSVTVPQIWNPDTLTVGYWYGNNSSTFEFDSSLVDRNYHTTAMLLPDGRVLVAGGNDDVNGGHNKADIYSPFYLFNANGSPRTRPVIQGAPTRVSYGEKFALQMGPDDTQITKVALVRPAATTHGFDQNQRYVPLAFSVMLQQISGERRYLVSAPNDSLDAPPGNYMLFALNGDGTPAIARWIQIRTTNLDTASPSTVADLVKVCSHGTWAELQWSTPWGDQGAAIKTPIRAYDLRWRTSSMPTWADFQQYGSPAAHTPAPALDPDASPTATTSVYNLSPGTQYYFRLVAKDFRSGNENWSALSNELTFTAYEEQCGGSGGGGGGGGHEDPLTAGNALTVGVEGGNAGSSKEFLENTLFANVPPATVSSDVLRLPHGPRWTGSAARIRLSHSGLGTTRFTGVRLRGVTAAQGQSTFSFDGDLAAGTLRAPLRVTQANGREQTAALAAGEAFEGHPGDTLLVEFTHSTPARLALATSGVQQVAAPRKTGIEVQCESPEGWHTVAHLNPRSLESSSLLGVPSAARIRLVFRGDHRLHSVMRFEPGTTAAKVSFEPAAITHSRLGELGSTGAEDILLAGGEHAYVDFAVPSEQAVGIDWFLEVRGERLAESGSRMAAERESPAETLPTRVMLHQNQPNPFAEVTRIVFDLPERTSVKIEVFDLAGRRVASLVNSEFAPGRHGVTWDRRGAGARVPAGIYTYRMIVGGREYKRQLVVF